MPKQHSLVAEKPESKSGDTNEMVGAGYRLGDDFERLKDATIMLVDDEQITMEVVRTFLEDAGYRNFVLVEDSTQAMSKLREHRPDVLLLDIMMPEVSGFDILGMLRKESQFEHLPVIILTSSSDAETKLTALDLAATDFLSKPVDPSELALRVRNTLGAKAYQDHLAYYDLLTNLPNRQLFMDRTTWAIERARRQRSKVAMLHIVFEDFKRVTDALGPKAGDDLLKQLADRLTDHVRGADVVSPGDGDLTGGMLDIFRLGSADFSVLAPGVTDIADAALIGRRILDAMNEPLDGGDTDVYLIPSIGIAGFPDDSTDTASLMKNAIGASSQALAYGGKRLRFYSETVNDASLRRLKLEADLRRSVDNGDFHLLYQPKIDVATGAIIGAEALIRWERRDGETVSPNEFIPVAEDMGLILPIGDWVIRESCRQVARWSDQGIDLDVSINISPKQFFEADFVKTFADILDESGVNPQHLVVEMTETLLMDKVDVAIGLLKELHDLGMALSIDDFGTGYSSLSYLKRFKVQEVKIDRSFLVEVNQSPEDQALIRAVTYLSHQLGARVCAEGVERVDQLEFLKTLRCDRYQGFLFSRPVKPDDFIALYKQSNSGR
jgi:diguanylate cyclase (GGDEF)-like protein